MTFLFLDIRAVGLLWLIGPAIASTVSFAVTDAAAQTGGITTCEVQDIEIEPANGIETPEERVLRLERALHESLNAYDECQTAAASGSAGSGSGTSVASGSAEGTGSDSNESADSGSGDNQASSETASSQQERDLRELNDASVVSIETTETSPSFASEVALDNGAIPEDIPPGNDDDIVARQIREAAIRETDPEVRERLWEDYRKYKGLPPQ